MTALPDGRDDLHVSDQLELRGLARRAPQLLTCCLLRQEQPPSSRFVDRHVVIALAYARALKNSAATNSLATH